MDETRDHLVIAIRRGRAALHRLRAPSLLLAVAVLWTLGTLAGQSARAQFSMVDDRPPAFEWRGRVGLDFLNEFATKSDGGDEFDARSFGFNSDFGGPINQSILLGFGVGYRHTSYDFNLGANPPPGYGSTALPRDPWNSLNTVDLLPNATVLVGSRVSLIVGVPIRWAGESGAEKNGFAAGISALVRWQVNDALSVGVGIGVTSQIEDNAETYPLIDLRWQISESFEFVTEGSWFQGGNATLLWGANQAVRLSLSAGYERTRFRLDRHGNAADRDGIGEVTALPIEVGVRFQFIKTAHLDFNFGVAFDSHLRVETDGGDKLYEQKYDPAPRIGVRLMIPFGLPAGSN
jgi:hypothetical protein